MVWVPKQKEIKLNEASKSQKSQPSTSTSHSHSIQKCHIPSHKKDKSHKNTKSMWVPKAIHHPSPKQTSPLLPTPPSHQKLQCLSLCVQPLVMVPFHFTKILTYLHLLILQLLSYISPPSTAYGSCFCINLSSILLHKSYIIHIIIHVMIHYLPYPSPFYTTTNIYEHNDIWHGPCDEIHL